MATAKVDSKDLVAEYVCHRLASSNYPNEQNCRRRVTPNNTQQALQALGDELEPRFAQTCGSILNKLHITPDTAHQTFKSIVEELFADGQQNWGRVVALFEFGSQFALRCVQLAMPQLVNPIIDWVSDYVDSKLAAWIAQNNGWAGLVGFYAKTHRNKKTTRSAAAFMKTCGYAAAGLVLTVGTLVAFQTIGESLICRMG